jgi:hypothetical protein
MTRALFLENGLPLRAVTVGQFCAMYRLSRQTTYNLINAGELASVLKGGRRLILVDSAEKFLGHVNSDDETIEAICDLCDPAGLDCGLRSARVYRADQKEWHEQRHHCFPRPRANDDHLLRTRRCKVCVLFIIHQCKIPFARRSLSTIVSVRGRMSRRAMEPRISFGLPARCLVRFFDVTR